MGYIFLKEMKQTTSTHLEHFIEKRQPQPGAQGQSGWAWVDLPQPALEAAHPNF